MLYIRWINKTQTFVKIDKTGKLHESDVTGEVGRILESYSLRQLNDQIVIDGRIDNCNFTYSNGQKCRNSENIERFETGNLE